MIVYGLGYFHNNKECLHEKCQAGVTISLVYKLQITYFNNIIWPKSTLDRNHKLLQTLDAGLKWDLSKSLLLIL